MNKTIIAHEPADMEEIGVDLAAQLRDGMLVSLVGPLGSGKTTLVKGIARGLLITDVVVSPSYVLAREYKGRLALHHVDAYRVSSLNELAEAGLDAELPPEHGVTVVEWPERIDGLVEASDILVYIELHDDGSRRVTLTTHARRLSAAAAPRPTRRALCESLGSAVELATRAGQPRRRDIAHKVRRYGAAPVRDAATTHRSGPRRHLTTTGVSVASSLPPTSRPDRVLVPARRRTRRASTSATLQRLEQDRREPLRDAP